MQSDAALDRATGRPTIDRDVDGAAVWRKRDLDTRESPAVAEDADRARPQLRERIDRGTGIGRDSRGKATAAGIDLNDATVGHRPCVPHRGSAGARFTRLGGRVDVRARDGPAIAGDRL